MIRKRAKWLAGAVLAAGAITAMPFQAFAQRSPEFAYSAEKWATLRDNKLEFDEISDLVHEYNLIHQHGFQSFGISPGKFVRHSFQLRVEINPTGAGAHRGEAGGQTMVFCAGAFYMLCNITCGSSDNRGNAGSFKSIDIIFFRQQVGGWNCDCANFMQCQNREPELIVALEHQHNHIAFFDAVFDKQVGGLIGIGHNGK